MMKLRLLLFLLCASAAMAADPDGAALYKKHCASCHDHGRETRAPDRDALKRLAPQAILASLTNGTMTVQAAGMSDAERRVVSEYLAGKPLPQGKAALATTVGMCSGKPPAFDPASGPRWNGWGAEGSNSRFQPAAMAGLSAADVPKLKLRWAFGFSDATSAFAQPAVVGGRVFVGSATGGVYSLDSRTGCSYWAFQAGAAVRTAITIAPLSAGGRKRHAAYFGDIQANVYAVDAATGELIWKTKVEDHKDARVTGAPHFYGGRVYVPVSSWEEGTARNPKYECCTFRGSVVALDGASGKQIWKTYSIAEAPKPAGKNKAGAQLYGPAGAAIWASPTVDPKRKLVYAVTGNGYTDPEPGTTDSLLAMDMESGRLVWARQLTAGDSFNLSCLSPDRINCAEKAGPDFDFGNSPILRSVGGGKQVLLIGQKSGVVYALDPDREGEPVWQARIGKGSALGGIMWGPAADEKTVYMPLSDVLLGPQQAGGLFALEIATGNKVWEARVPPGCTGQRWCTPALSAAISVIPGVVFSGAIDGHLRAYSTADGSVIWDFDAVREFTTVNQVKAKGGSFDAAGPVVAGGMVFVNSGYGFWYGAPGNVLLAFGP